ncbi:MAG: hypothetical protein F4164_13210, partial [Gemmatimonadales bacterium]|nr:hypothetical protein [Gemmatimonadales bacterium]
GCGDERDTMLAEYGEYGVTGGPSSCDDFVGSGGGANFSWSELNGGFTDGHPHSPWGLDAVNSTLFPGLQATRTNYGNQPIRVTSGYRCPHGNASIPRADPQSNHMHGIAADIYGVSPWNEAEFDRLMVAAKLANGSPMKLEDGSDMTYDTYADHHLHINY